MPLDVSLPRSDAERPDLGTSQIPNPTSIRLVTISATVASDRTPCQHQCTRLSSAPSLVRIMLTLLFGFQHNAHRDSPVPPLPHRWVRAFSAFIDFDSANAAATLLRRLTRSWKAHAQVLRFAFRLGVTAKTIALVSNPLYKIGSKVGYNLAQHGDEAVILQVQVGVRGRAM